MCVWGGTGARSCGGKGVNTAPVALVLCSALDAVFVMVPSAAGAGLQQQGTLPEAHQLLQRTLKSSGPYRQYFPSLRK